MDILNQEAEQRLEYFTDIFYISQIGRMDDENYLISYHIKI